MLDIKYVREHAAEVQEKSQQKGFTVDVSHVLVLDERRRELQATIEPLRQERNDLAASFKSQKPTEDQLAHGKQLKERIAELETQLTTAEDEFMRALKQLPNMPLPDVPVGATEEENIVIKTWGEQPVFDFEPKNHWQLAEARDWIDKVRAAKVAGSRFAYVKGDLALLWFALLNFGLSVLTNQKTLQKVIDENNLSVSAKPFTLILPPAVARTEVYDATARLNKEEQTYKLADDDLWLNASAEHTMAPMYLNEILPEEQLPIRLVGYTTAFRREAGTYGKDMEGIFRLHQFNKLEMESFTVAEQSFNEHLFMIALQEYLMQQLELPYQVILKCTADIGGPNARGVDINTWLPGQQRYRETHTADLITDYQARRMQTRVRRINGVELVHTNDATVFAERPMIAILENYQQADGTIKVPTVLQPYLGKKQL